MATVVPSVTADSEQGWRHEDTEIKARSQAARLGTQSGGRRHHTPYFWMFGASIVHQHAVDHGPLDGQS